MAYELINEKTLLVSIQTANNEIRDNPKYFTHCAKLRTKMELSFTLTAAQAVGKIPIKIQEMDVDFLSISAHKLYGPKGVGALFFKGWTIIFPSSSIAVWVVARNTLYDLEHIMFQLL